MTWTVIPRNLWNDIVSWRTKKTQQLYKVSISCIDDHHFQKEEEFRSWGELSKVCSQNVLKYLYLARIGRPDILWSMNKLARSITKWTKACDNRLSRLISYIHHTNNTNNIVMWETLAIFQEILRTQNPLLEEHCVFPEIIHLFRSVGCVRSKPQFHTVNRIRNHFFGCKIEVGRYTQTWFMGSDRHSSTREHASEWSRTVRPV